MGTIVSILVLVATCMIIDKAHEGWWKGIIPFYGSYTMYKIAGKKKLWWVQFAITMVSLFGLAYFFSIMFSSLLPTMMDTSSYYDELAVVENMINTLTSMVTSTNFILVMSILGLLSTASLAISIIYNIALAKAFGQSGAFAVGLILVQPIFLCILAFSGSIQYVGSEENVEPMVF